MSFFRKCLLSSSSGRQLLDREGWGMYRKRSWCCPSFGSWDRRVHSWHQLPCLTCWVAVGTPGSRHQSAPISTRARAPQRLKVLNTLLRLFHLGKTVGGEVKTTVTMFKLHNRLFQCKPGLSSSLHLFKFTFVSQTFFFNIHAFPSLTWLSWHSRPSC